MDYELRNFCIAVAGTIICAIMLLAYFLTEKKKP